MTAPLSHDQVGRLVGAYLAGRRSTGLPEGAAFEAFRRLHHLDDRDVASLRAVLVVVERAEQRTA